MHARIIIVALSFLLPLAANADNTLADNLTQCAETPDDAARLSCYDGLARSQEAPDSSDAPATGLPAAAVSMPEAATTASGPAPITDDVGIERVRGNTQDDAEEYSANVTRCEEHARSGQYYFFFENGQVWKQANYRRLGYRDCRFEVILSKDNFGYQLYIPSKDRTVRVSRVR